MSGCLSAVGILFNLVCIVLLGRDKALKNTIRFMLQSLAVADTAILVCYLAIFTLQGVVADTEFERTWWAYIEVYTWPAWYIAQLVSNWTVVIITVDRYVAVCWPLKAVQYSTMSRVRIAVAVV
jgi:neuropeptide Y receptor type 1